MKPLRALAAGLLAVLAPFLLLPPATSATYKVVMEDNLFTPARLSVPLGSSVFWTNGDGVTHTATSNQGLFNTGDVIGGGGKTLLFPFAGSFGYYCKYHRSMGMTGAIFVPVSGPSSDPDRFRLRWATDAASLTNRTFDVQKMAPGTTTWVTQYSNTKNRYLDTWPSRTGTWKYRVRTDNTVAGTSSGWSPVKYVKVT